MRLKSIFVIVLLSVILASTIACETETYSLYTTTDGQGVISPSSGTYDDGEVVAITASPASGWEFDRWEGFFNGSENPVYIRMNSDKTLNAYFTELPTPTPTATPIPTQTFTPTPTPTPIATSTSAPTPTPVPWSPDLCGSYCCKTFEFAGSSMVMACGVSWEDNVFVYSGEFIYEDEPDRGYRNLRDPSYAELIGFLATDKTNEITYSFPDFVCLQFSLTLRENANKQGWRCAFVETNSVLIGSSGYNSHAISAFNTTDRGIIYIDPQTDRICLIGEQTTQPSMCCGENIEELYNLCDIPIVNQPGYIFRIIRIW
ncbi:MAG: hypothetical protein WC562_07975 [Dehalococcoidia bacterium]